MLTDAQVRALAERAGPGGILTEPADRARYGTDWTGQFGSLPAAVVRPVDHAAVCRVLAWCSAEGVAVVPQGGRTGLVGGSVPLTDEVVVSLERLRAVRRLALDDRAVVVEAGVTLAAVDAFLAPHGLRMPVDLASRGSAQVGGLVATSAGGIRHVRDGSLASHVRGLEVALGDGRSLAALRTLEKNNTGYPWPQLLCGSEGTLGVITAAAVGLVPRAAASAAAWFALDGPARVPDLAALATAEALGMVAAVEFVDRTALAAVTAHLAGARPPAGDAPMHVLIEVEASRPAWATQAIEAIAQAALSAGLCADAAIALDEGQRRSMWRLRETIPEAVGRQGPVRRYDVAVPPPALPGLLEAAAARVAAAGLPARPVAYGHAAEGNAHLNFVLPAGLEAAERARIGEALDAIVYGEVLARSGTISAEHGIGVLKRTHLGQMRTPDELAFMAALKRACDPAGILNPGKVLEGEAG